MNENTTMSTSGITQHTAASVQRGPAPRRRIRRHSRCQTASAAAWTTNPTPMVHKNPSSGDPSVDELRWFDYVHGHDMPVGPGGHSCHEVDVDEVAQ